MDKYEAKDAIQNLEELVSYIKKKETNGGVMEAIDYAEEFISALKSDVFREAPLSIDELRALKEGDWIWLIIDGEPWGYRKILSNQYDYIQITDEGLDYRKDYGTRWIVYRNKEQAEALTDDFREKYIALKAAVIDVCDKLGNKEFSDKFYRLTLGGRLSCIEAAEEAKLQSKGKKE